MLRFRCAYPPLGNGIVERSHRSIKRIATRKQCTVEEAVYWYNVMLKDGVHSLTAPANALYTYEVRVKGIHKALPLLPEHKHGTYEKGDAVLVGAQPNSYLMLMKCNSVIVLMKIRIGHTIGIGYPQ